MGALAASRCCTVQPGVLAGDSYIRPSCAPDGGIVLVHPAVDGVGALNDQLDKRLVVLRGARRGPEDRMGEATTGVSVAAECCHVPCSPRMHSAVECSAAAPSTNALHSGGLHHAPA